MALRLSADQRGGDQVLVASEVRLEVEGRTLLRDFSAHIGRGEIVGLVGPNGAGKSTLIRAIVGERAPDAGEIRIPDSVRIAHYRQDLAQVPPDRTIYEIIADLRPAWGRGPIQGHLGRFGFSGDAVQRRAASLSGGEAARVALAIMMLSGANFLIFDEPTNHLDVESIEALEDAIEEFDGTVLLVSHDRALLRVLTSRTWVLHGGRITDFDGGFAEWEVASAEREHAAAVAAAEEERLRRVRERKSTRRPGDDRRRQHSTRRTAERAVAEAEQRVGERELRVANLRGQLEDPTLYLASDGPDRAHRLGIELEAARIELEAAFTAWEAATRSLEALG